MTSFQIDQIVKTFHLVASNGVARWAARKGDTLEGSWAANPMELVQFAEAYEDWNFYVQPNPSQKRHGKRCSAADVTDWRWFLVDLDPSSSDPVNEDDYGDAIFEVVAALQAYMGKAYTPLTLHSGRGRQLWFRLTVDEPWYCKSNLASMFKLTRVGLEGIEVIDEIPMRSAVQDAQRYWLKQLAGRVTSHYVSLDTSTSDLPRLMRCPGTINTKTGEIARFFTAYDEKTHFCAGLAEKLLRYVPVTEFRRGYQGPLPARSPFSEHQPWQAAAAWCTGRGADYLSFGALEPGRHSGAVAAARSLAEQGVSEGEILKALAFGGSLCRPELDDAAYFDRTAKDAVSRVRPA